MAGWLEPLRWRGLVQDSTPLPGDPRDLGAAYVGIDPTADSLHIGHLVPLQLLYHLAQKGIRPIVVVGGATARIGDPSGKKNERPLLPAEVVAANARALAAQLERLLPFPFELVDNASWLERFSLIDFLRDVGKHLTVSYLLAKETVQSRLESGISFTEFSYPLLQAYDFYHLFQARGCRLQVGGADQWGNITAGIELIRKLTGQEAHGLTCPLLTRADGTKFGKSESGENLWLAPEKTSPYRFYQFWMGQADADMPRLLKAFSWKDEAELEALLAEQGATPERRAAQRSLAFEMTARVHGEAVAQAVARVSEAVFGSRSLQELEALPEAIFQQVVAEMPLHRVRALERPLLEVLVESGFLRSRSEGRQLIQQGGLWINRQRVAGEQGRLEDFGRVRRRYWLVQRGRRHLAWLEEIPS